MLAHLHLLSIELFRLHSHLPLVIARGRVDLHKGGPADLLVTDVVHCTVGERQSTEMQSHVHGESKY